MFQLLNHRLQKLGSFVGTALLDCKLAKSSHQFWHAGIGDQPAPRHHQENAIHIGRRQMSVLESNRGYWSNGLNVPLLRSNDPKQAQPGRRGIPMAM